jgi:peptidoglycan/LPS O-acetylase OafA/YrhL
MWAVSVVLSVLRFHQGIGYPWTLNAFSLLVFLWIAREIAAARQFGTRRALESAGHWSYSLYLMHLTFGAFVLMVLPKTIPLSGIWSLRLPAAFIGSYAFYRVVERPAHRFARRAYKWLERLPMRVWWRESLTFSLQRNGHSHAAVLVNHVADGSLGSVPHRNEITAEIR